jgi:hypothetical protein
MTMLAVTALAGCSSRRSDEVSRGDYPYVGPADESSSQYARDEGAPRRTNTYARARTYSPGGTGYYSRWAYEYGRDPSYDYYLASDAYRGWSDDFPEEYAYFYDELDPYGDWYEDDRYGWVWSPEYVSADWQPYLYGYWVYTDWGWTWVSNDPWGADTYHYGRWDCDASNRWVWIPDDVWGPAWVSWRYGGGWAGWAPLPPEATWGSFGLSYADHLVLPSRWCFVPESRLTSTRLRTYVAPLPETRRLYTETRDVTRYAVVNGRPAERGLRPALIERRTGRNIPEYKLVTRERGQRRDIVRGRTLVAPMPLTARGGGRLHREPQGLDRESRAQSRGNGGDRQRLMQREAYRFDQQQARRQAEQAQLERRRQMDRDRGRQMQIERGRQQHERQMQRDRAENESRFRAQQARFEREQARQRADQAQFQRAQARQQAEQERIERRQQQDQQPERQQQPQEARGRRDDGQPSGNQAERPSRRGGAQPGSDQRGHGRGRGRDR